MLRSWLEQATQLKKTLWNNHASEVITGLEINATQIKLLKFNIFTNPICIEHYAIVDMPPGAMVKHEIKDADAISEKLMQTFNQSGITTKNVAIAIPRSLAIIKTIPIDSRMQEDEIESRVWIEANRHFPDLIGDIYLDFTINQVGHQSQSELTLVACRKDQINPYLIVVNNAGLQVKLVDVDSYALERALPLLTETNSKDTIALLNLNATISTLIVEQEKQLLYAHDQNFDMERLLAQTNAYLKLKATDGTENEIALIEDPEYYNILKENLIAHLRHMIHFFFSNRPNIAIQKLFLAGDCTFIPGLTTFIQREIGIDTELANPFAHLTFNSSIDLNTLKQYAPSLVECAGLALSKLPDTK